jgi:hypothetical protein
VFIAGLTKTPKNSAASQGLSERFGGKLPRERAQSRQRKITAREKRTNTKEQNKMRTTVLLLLVFVAIVIMPATSNAEDPTAVATTANVTTAGGTLYSFTVRYADDGEINVSTLGNDDVRVTGPGGFDVAAAFVGVNINVDGSPRIATYSIVPPGGSWDFADNGTYNVVMQAKAVFDSIRNPVAAGNIGSFSAMIPTSTPTPTPSPSPTPTPSSSAQLLNISTRTEVLTGEQVLIGGFIITGNDPKKVILRAIGPSLSGAGIPNPLADPVLELHGADGSLITSNDNWKDSQQTEIEATGIQPQNDLESAIVSTLTPGNYTAVMNGKNGTTGVGLVEGYDLDQAADSQLANISTRGLVETGSDVMIGGFILSNGGASANVLIRALGPSLASAGVSGALADPTLELHDGNGALIQSNDNWKDTQQTEIEATDIPPQNDLESALVATLNPAAYTAIVAGKGGLTGVGLVEVYRLP